MSNANVAGGYITIPLGRNTWERKVAKEPSVYTINRYFEQTPENLDTNISLLLRPALKVRTFVGDGPIRGVFQQDGAFNGDAFVVSGNILYRVTKSTDNLVTPDTVTAITGGVAGTDPVHMTISGETGSPNYLWVSDENTLQYYADGAALATCALPDGVSPTSLDYIKGYVIVTVGSPFDRRFYWVQPGSVVVDPLDFAEAESSFDKLINVMTLGDQFWLFGTTITEAWYVTGDPTAPMAPLLGRPYNRGLWPFTDVKVNDQVIIVGHDGRVYSIYAGPQPISYPGIEERIRRAMFKQIYGPNA